jgi:hypothetical protein
MPPSMLNPLIDGQDTPPSVIATGIAVYYITKGQISTLFSKPVIGHVLHPLVLVCFLVVTWGCRRRMRVEVFQGNDFSSR